MLLFKGLKEQIEAGDESFRLEVYQKLNLMELVVDLMETASRNYPSLANYTPGDVIALMALFNTKRLGDGYHDSEEWGVEE